VRERERERLVAAYYKELVGEAGERRLEGQGRWKLTEGEANDRDKYRKWYIKRTFTCT